MIDVMLHDPALLLTFVPPALVVGCFLGARFARRRWRLYRRTFQIGPPLVAGFLYAAMALTNPNRAGMNNNPQIVDHSIILLVSSFLTVFVWAVILVFEKVHFPQPTARRG